MSQSKQTFIIAIVAVVGLVGGFFLNQSLNKPDVVVKKNVEATTPDVRPAFQLKDIEGKVRDIKEWDGQVVMLNFWATWCPPCRREIPALIELQDAYKDKGFSIIGVSIDTKEQVIDFTDPMGVNYPLLIADQEGIAIAKAYGNRLGVLPYTVFIDRKGKIVKTHRNELTFKEAESIIKPLL